MKAISLWQPWASLIAIGAKPFETRHWCPPADLIGQTIAIHAAKRVNGCGCTLADELVYTRKHGVLIGAALVEHAETAPSELCGTFGHVALPAGCVVATARLDAAFLLGPPADGTAAPAASVVRRLTSRPMPECFTVRYDAFGDYGEGRWAWLLRDVKALAPPAPVIGRQGLFELPQGWLTEAV